MLLKDVVDQRWNAGKRSGSMITHEKTIASLLNTMQPKSILEIGTLNGLSAAMFAKYSQRVLTIDIEANSDRQQIWEALGLQERISEKVIDDNESKKEWIIKQDFNLAFVDADHSYQGVSFDFDCVEHCGAILFHDYKPDLKKFKGLVRFLDGLKPSIYTFGSSKSRFALWLSNSSSLRSNSKLMQWLGEHNQSKRLDPFLNPFRPYLWRPKK
jgi:hypothetical protein